MKKKCIFWQDSMAAVLGEHPEKLWWQHKIKDLIGLPRISLHAFKWQRPWDRAVITGSHFSLAFISKNIELEVQWAALGLANEKRSVCIYAMCYKWKITRPRIKKCIFIFTFPLTSSFPGYKIKRSHKVYDL